MERAAGIEPASLAWKAKVLPLHNARIMMMNIRSRSNSQESLTDIGRVTDASLTISTGTKRKPASSEPVPRPG